MHGIIVLCFTNIRNITFTQHILSSGILKVLICCKYFASCFWYIMDGLAPNGQAPQELFGALCYQGTIINISGQHVSPMHTSSKKALNNTTV
jgi:hypothetical protein